MHQIASQKTLISKIFPEKHAPKTPQKSAPFAVLMGTIIAMLPLYTISLGPLYHKILHLPLNTVCCTLQYCFLFSFTNLWIFSCLFSQTLLACFLISTENEKSVFTLLIMQADSSPLHPFWLSHQFTLASCCKLIPLIFSKAALFRGTVRLIILRNIFIINCFMLLPQYQVHN